MFALKNKETGDLMRFRCSSTGGAFCTNVEFYLDGYGDSIWVVTSREVAEKAAITNAEWFNATYQTPSNDYVGKLEVVELAVVA